MHPLARHPARDRPLRIGMLAPIAWRVPPRHYGPWERVVSLLTEGLVKSGVDVAGIVQDRTYFEREVEPYLASDVHYVGSVEPPERDRLLGGAMALLHLIHFDEPFGLSVAEAMACGTPVIAYTRGSMPRGR